MNWSDYFMGVLTSISATVFMAITVTILPFTKKINFILCRKAIKRIMESRISSFYYNRETLSSDMGSIGDFLDKSEREIYHIGFWLSSTLDNQNLDKLLRDHLETGKKVHICLLDPKSPLLNYYSDFLGSDTEDVKNKIVASINILTKLKNELSYNSKDNLKLYLHNKINTTSIWVLDLNYDKSYVFLDHKIINNNRYNTYGFEVSCNKNNTFGKNLCDTVHTIINSSEEIKIRN